ncbi:hypothetical protein QBC45DRAFT_443791 [Copromyces sp. CBS 386.78]|nr:hypothetical protein QBC45DRAFT_443791 [Copromyces sp. CBS 386.78]
MPQSTRSQSNSNDTTMNDHSTDPYTIELDPERLRLSGRISNDDDHPLTNGNPPTNGHLTNGYHSNESNTAEEVQIRPPVRTVAPSNSGQPSSHIRTTETGEGTGTGTGARQATTLTNVTGTTIITGITINGTHITDITITGTNIAGTTITGTRISGVTINGTNINGATINGVSQTDSGATVKGTTSIDNLAAIESAVATVNKQRAVIADAEARIKDLEREVEFARNVAWIEIVCNEMEESEHVSPDPVVIGGRSTQVFSTVLYPNINPTRLTYLLSREFGDPWESYPPKWRIEVSK